MNERELFLKHMKSIGSANFMFELDELCEDNSNYSLIFGILQELLGASE